MNKIIFAGLLCGSLCVASAVRPLLASVSAPVATKSSLVGKPRPAWNIPRPLWMNTPRPIASSSLVGQVTVIEFFRIGCSHCQEAAASRRALFLKYQPRGVKFIGFQSPASGAGENSWTQVQKVVRGWKIPYPVAFDTKRALFNACGLQFFPTVLVVDKTGVVRFQQTGYDKPKEKALEQFLATMLPVKAMKKAAILKTR